LFSCIAEHCQFTVFLRFVGHTTGPKTYYFTDDLARMEEALVRFALDTLLKKYVSFLSSAVYFSDLVKLCHSIHSAL